MFFFFIWFFFCYVTLACFFSSIYVCFLLSFISSIVFIILNFATCFSLFYSSKQRFWITVVWFTFRPWVQCWKIGMIMCWWRLITTYSSPTKSSSQWLILLLYHHQWRRWIFLEELPLTFIIINCLVKKIINLFLPVYCMSWVLK